MGIRAKGKGNDMRILEPGEPGLDRRHIQFTCRECGCVFEEKRENTEETYMEAMGVPYMIEFETRCPWCAARVKMSFQYRTKRK